MLFFTAELFHELGEALVVPDEILVFALSRNAAIVDSVDVVALGKEVKCVGDENDGLAAVAESADDGVVEQRTTDMRINWIKLSQQFSMQWQTIRFTSRQRVIEKNDVRIVIQRTSDVDLGKLE